MGMGMGVHLYRTCGEPNEIKMMLTGFFDFAVLIQAATADGEADEADEAVLGAALATFSAATQRMMVVRQSAPLPAHTGLCVFERERERGRECVWNKK